MAKPIPLDVHDFCDLIEGGYYHVDRTLWLKSFFSREEWTFKVLQIITRPCMFGRTMLLSMFARFLEWDPGHPGDQSRQRRLFAGTAIMEDEEFCRRYMGKFPVIFFSMKEVAGKTNDEAYRSLGDLVLKILSPYAYLKDSPKLSDCRRRSFASLLDPDFVHKPENLAPVCYALGELIDGIKAHHGIAPVVLVDDYDAPIISAARYGFASSMQCKVLSFLGIALDCCEKNYYKAVMVGSTKVVEGGISSYFDHFVADAIYWTNAMKILGFSRDEARLMLDHYGLAASFDEAEAECGSYRVDDEFRFSPTLLSRFIAAHAGCDGGTGEFGADSRDFIDGGWILQDYCQRHLRYAYALQRMLDGEAWDGFFEFCTDYSVPERKGWELHRESLMTFLGYLTFNEIKKFDRSEHEFMIPNLTVYRLIAQTLPRNLGGETTWQSIAEDLFYALWQGREGRLCGAFIVSLRSSPAMKEPDDLKACKMLLDLMAEHVASEIADYRSKVSDDGRSAEVSFRLVSKKRADAVVLVIKSAASDEYAAIRVAAGDAVRQAIRLQEVNAHDDAGIRVYGLGIGKRRDLVCFKTLASDGGISEIPVLKR